MELALSTYSLARWRRENRKSVEQSLDWIASAGVRAVEFSGLGEDAPTEPAAAIRRATALRRRCDQLGLAVVGYNTAAELLLPSAEQRQAVERLRRQVDVAAALGAPSLRHDVTRGPTPPRRLRPPQVIAAVVPAIRRVTEYAAGLGIKTSLENHGFYLQNPGRIEKLIRAVAHPNFGLTLDMGNFLVMNLDAVEAVRRLAPYAIMAHIKDFHVRPKRTMPPNGWFATPAAIALRGAVAGHGVIDIPAQLRELKRAGYDRYLALEFEGIEEPTQGIRWGLEYLRTVM